MNALRRVQVADGITDKMVEGLAAGVYECFCSGDEEPQKVTLINTGGLSVNCRCLVIAETMQIAQQLLDECDPAASGDDSIHLWLESMTLISGSSGERGEG